MKLKRLFSFVELILFILIIQGCDTSSSKEIENLKEENLRLKTELDECKFGAAQLINESKQLYDNKEFEKAKNTLLILKEKHPSSTEAKEAEVILVKVEAEIQKQIDLAEKERLARELAEKQRILNATKKMRSRFDDVKGITWYYDKTTPNYDDNKNIHLYFGKEKDGIPWLRLRIRYASDDWLFIESYNIKADENTYTISTSYNEVERDNGYGGIWEWYDTDADARILAIVNAIINSKTAKLRYNGRQYHFDKIISNSEKIALQNVLDAFTALGGTLNK